MGEPFHQNISGYERYNGDFRLNGIFGYFISFSGCGNGGVGGNGGSPLDYHNISATNGIDEYRTTSVCFVFKLRLL